MPYVEVKKTLKIIALEKNITLTTLAKNVGINPTEMSFWANGYKPIPLEYLGKLSVELNMKREELLEVLFVSG